METTFLLTSYINFPYFNLLMAADSLLLCLFICSFNKLFACLFDRYARTLAIWTPMYCVIFSYSALTIYWVIVQNM